MAMDLYSKDLQVLPAMDTTATSIADAFAPVGAFVVADAAEATTTSTVIKATAHVAAVGDIIVMTSGSYDGEARVVSAVDANTITLTSALSGAPAAGNTFNILRPVNLLGRVKMLEILSTLDQPVWLSTDGSTEEMYIPAGSTTRFHQVYNLRANNLHLPTTSYVYAKKDSSSPTAGLLVVRLWC